MLFVGVVANFSKAVGLFRCHFFGVVVEILGSTFKMGGTGFLPPFLVLFDCLLALLSILGSICCYPLSCPNLQGVFFSTVFSSFLVFKFNGFC